MLTPLKITPIIFEEIHKKCLFMADIEEENYGEQNLQQSTGF